MTGKGDNDTSSLWGWPREGAGEIPMKAAKPFAGFLRKTISRAACEAMSLSCCPVWKEVNMCS